MVGIPDKELSVYLVAACGSLGGWQLMPFFNSLAYVNHCLDNILRIALCNGWDGTDLIPMVLFQCNLKN